MSPELELLTYTTDLESDYLNREVVHVLKLAPNSMHYVAKLLALIWLTPYENLTICFQKNVGIVLLFMILFAV